jgi:hypothetical protein
MPAIDADSSAAEGLRTGGVTLAALAVTIAVFLGSGTMTALDMLRPGELGPSAGLVEQVVGPDALMPDEVGYDGQQLWAMAETFPDLDAAAPHVDDPAYRFQRILTPMLASVAGGGQASALALVALTVLGVALCVGCTTDLCVRHGRTPLGGYLAILPLAWAIGYSTTEPVAYGLATLGLCLADRRRYVAAGVAIAAGGLARESAVAFALAVGLALGIEWAQHRRRPPWSAAWLLLPVAVVGAWTIWVRSAYEATSREQRIVPFGIVDASATGLLLGTGTLALAVLAIWGWRDVPVVWTTSLAFGAMVLTYYGPLFRGPALLRVSAPVLTFGLVALVELARRRAGPPGTVGAVDGDTL